MAKRPRGFEEFTEEDPGRLVYESGGVDFSSSYTLIDYNRAGISLVEIVTEPDFTDPKDACVFLNKITSIIEHLGVCNTKRQGSVSVMLIYQYKEEKELR